MRVFAADGQTVFTADKRLRTIGGKCDAIGQREINVIGSVRIDRDIARLRHRPVVAHAPEFAAVEAAPETIEARGVNDVAIARIEREGADARVIVTEVLPLARGVTLKNTVGRDDFGADDVVAIDISADKKIVGRRSGRESPQRQKTEENES